MANLDELEQTIDAALSRLGIDAATIERHPDSTIVPKSRETDTVGEWAAGLLGDLAAATTISRKLDLHGTIGEGGMGIVRLGTQRSLSRQVAVKTIKQEVKCERTTIKLLREAWITGSLEHPNVVPIYDVALEEDGSPLIVLKRIEGTSWDRLIHDAETVKKRFGVVDLLEWNLQILMQVCNAVHFAHSRGVLHRDLKPENVMIGEFGEVYLVDWGIAVSLRDDETGRLPLAKDALELAGTPLYMAPEMLGGRESRLSERTDVYLLGAILYEIAAGRPPHAGEMLMELVHQIVESTPDLPDDVPAEISTVIRRAMDPDPHGRFESAAQVRLCLQGFLQHRDAAALAARAARHLAELESRLADLGSDVPFEDREPIYQLFGECRFGFRHALEIWPESAAAKDGLQRAIGALVEFELRLGEPEAARTLLTELPALDGALADRVELARKQREDEGVAIRALQAEHDPSAGRRTRALLAVVIGSVWSVTPLLGEVAARMGWIREPSHLLPIVFDSAFLVGAAAIGIWARESIMRTRMNRVLAVATVLSIGAELLAHIVAVAVGSGDVMGTFRFGFLAWAAISGMAAAAVDWRLVIPGAAFAIGFVVLAWIPEGTFIALSCCCEVLLVTVVVLWLRREDLDVYREHIKEQRAKRHAWIRAHIGPRPGSKRGEAS